MTETQKLARRARRLLRDLADAGLVLTFVSPGGQPFAAIHPVGKCYECDIDPERDPEFIRLGKVGVGDMLAP